MCISTAQALANCAPHLAHVGRCTFTDPRCYFFKICPFFGAKRWRAWIEMRSGCGGKFSRQAGYLVNLDDVEGSKLRLVKWCRMVILRGRRSALDPSNPKMCSKYSQFSCFVACLIFSEIRTCARATLSSLPVGSPVLCLAHPPCRLARVRSLSLRRGANMCKFWDRSRGPLVNFYASQIDLVGAVQVLLFLRSHPSVVTLCVSNRSREGAVLSVADSQRSWGRDLSSCLQIFL
jgi:hypothetical protein